MGGTFNTWARAASVGWTYSEGSEQNKRKPKAGAMATKKPLPTTPPSLIGGKPGVKV